MYTRVLLVGNDPSVKGGITSVITQILSHDWESENIDMTFIPTYIETNTVNKVLYYIKAYIKIRRLLKNKKIDVVHIHMSYRGSFYRNLRSYQLWDAYNCE